MKHISAADFAVRRTLNRARVVAVVGASPKPERHSHTIVRYLHDVGYDVVPVRPDGQPVLGLPSFRSLDEVPSRVDLVVVCRRPDAAAEHVAEALRKQALAVWLEPGVATPAAERLAAELGILLVKDRCIEVEHRHDSERHGSPRTLQPGIGASARRTTRRRA